MFWCEQENGRRVDDERQHCALSGGVIDVGWVGQEEITIRASSLDLRSRVFVVQMLPATVNGAC